MSDIHQLENKMRMIKLSGMVEALDMRLSQAQKEGLAFTQFLEILLEDEVQHRVNKKLASRIIRAHFEEDKSLRYRRCSVPVETIEASVSTRHARDAKAVDQHATHIYSLHISFYHV